MSNRTFLDKNGWPVERIIGRPFTNFIRLVLHSRWYGKWGGCQECGGECRGHPDLGIAGKYILALLLLAVPLSAQNTQTTIVPDVEVTVLGDTIVVNVEVMTDSAMIANLNANLEALRAEIAERGCESCGGQSNVTVVANAALTVAAFLIVWRLGQIANKEHPDHPSHPSHPSHEPHPDHPDHPEHPEHPEHPTHATHPDHPDEPEHPSHPDHPDEPRHPAHPDHPKHLEHPDHPDHPDDDNDH